MTLYEAMSAACDAVGICVPQRTAPGVWSQSPVIGKKASNRSGRVLIFDDQRGGIAKNYATGIEERFSITGDSQRVLSDRERSEITRQRRERAERAEREQNAVAQICADIVRECRPETHPYLERKGFPDEVALVHDDPRKHFPANRFGERLMKSMMEFDAPLLVVPGRIGKTITTVQFIRDDGEKKNILRGKMDGACHRIATGRETWVAEGFATGLTIRAALGRLGRSATVLCGFSASNVEKVAKNHPYSIIAADNDNPVAQFDGQGTGEFYARRSGHVWTMPPNVEQDFNDFQSDEGLRAVALHLKGVAP
ncbi:hypothetical protein [Ponticaulis profundi]|uniref:Toprim domain-containing protein n=1 Tax=Ponticaulis profundi TaxID=2665222 RepID=A0ABW1S828_9PROT